MQLSIPKFILLSSLLTGALILVIYHSSLQNDFFDVDDPYFVVNNPATKGISPENIYYIFFEDTRDFHYFPMAYLSLALDYELFGHDAYYHRLVNILLHLLNSLLVLLFIWRLTRNKPAALIGALLFAVHPQQVESVVWIINRKNVLYLFFYLASLHTYLCYKKSFAYSWKRSVPAYFATLLFFVFSALTKTTAITLPAILLLTDYLLAKDDLPSFWKFIKRYVPDKIPFLAMAVLLYFPNIAASERMIVAGDYGYTFLHHIIIIGHNIFYYIYRIFYPFELAPFYPAPEISGGMLPWHFYFFAVLGYGLIALTIFAFRRWHYVFYGLAFYVITLSPMLNLILLFNDIPMIVADRYFYQSSIGLFLLAGLGISRLLVDKKTVSTVTAIVIGLSIMALGWASYRQTLHWKDSEAMYKHLLEHYPSEEMYYRLAFYYDDRQQQEEAFHYLEKARDLKKDIFYMDFPPVLNRLGIMYATMGDAETAHRFFEEANLKAPGNTMYLENLGTIHYTLGDTADAIGNLQESIQANNNNINAYYKLGIIYLEQQAYKRAAAQLERALELSPGHYGATEALIKCYEQLGDEGMANHYRKQLQQLGG